MFDPELDKRIVVALERRGVAFATKKMFGGVCYLVDEKMALGIVKDALMVRFDPALNDEILARDDAREMDFTKRPMKGYAFVDADRIKDETQLGFWIDLALEYNPRAKASKKKEKK